MSALPDALRTRVPPVLAATHGASLSKLSYTALSEGAGLGDLARRRQLAVTSHLLRGKSSHPRTRAQTAVRTESWRGHIQQPVFVGLCDCLKMKLRCWVECWAELWMLYRRLSSDPKFSHQDAKLAAGKGNKSVLHTIRMWTPPSCSPVLPSSPSSPPILCPSSPPILCQPSPVPPPNPQHFLQGSWSLCASLHSFKIKRIWSPAPTQVGL